MVPDFKDIKGSKDKGYNHVKGATHSELYGSMAKHIIIIEIKRAMSIKEGRTFGLAKPDLGKALG